MGFITLKYDFAFKYVMMKEKVRKHFASDVLGIPLEDIKSVRIANTFLWKRYFRQKQGILDLLVELNDDSKVNIELQIKMLKFWDKRALFYLSKMFTEDLLFGEKYTKLKKCYSISILDFNLDDDENYHKVYRFYDKYGNLFTDLLEIHIIELRKELDGNNRMDDWIRLINAETEEDLKMLQAKTENLGVLAAIKEIMDMNLRKQFRIMHEMRLKEIRDRNARDEYVWDEGMAKGKAEDILRLLVRNGAMPEDLQSIILKEKDIDTLAQWFNFALEAENADDFRRKAKI